MIGTIKAWLARKRYTAARRRAEKFNESVELINGGEPQLVAVFRPHIGDVPFSAIYLGCAKVWERPPMVGDKWIIDGEGK